MPSMLETWVDARSQDEPITAAQVALLQRGAEILASRPPVNGEMRSHCVEMDESTAQQLGGRRQREAVQGCGRFVRHTAAGLSVAVLVCCVAVLCFGDVVKSAALSMAPVTLTSTVLANSELDWLGGGASGDPYAADSADSSRRAHLAPAALSAEASWKKTVGGLLGDWGGSARFQGLAEAREARTRTDGSSDSGAFGANYPQPPRDVEPHGRLLPTARQGELLWRQQIKAMQAGELQANRDVMDTVALLGTHNHDKAAEKQRLAQSPALKLHDNADRKAMAHARLSNLAAKTAAASAGKPGSVPQKASAVKSAGKNAHAVLSAHKKAGAPGAKQMLKSVTAKPTDMTELDVATSESSRQELSSFFDSLAARDEAKHVLHEARYPRSHSVRKVLPTSIMHMEKPHKEMKHLETEVTWLRKRLEVLQNALLKEVDTKAAHSPRANGQVRGTTKALATNDEQEKAGGGKGKKENTRESAVEGRKQEDKSEKAIARELKQPPPRGCPLFAAPGEQLPSDCPRVSLSQMALHTCADGSVRLKCERERSELSSYMDEAESR